MEKKEEEEKNLNFACFQTHARAAACRLSASQSVSWSYRQASDKACASRQTSRQTGKCKFDRLGKRAMKNALLMASNNKVKSRFAARLEQHFNVLPTTFNIHLKLLDI